MVAKDPCCDRASLATRLAALAHPARIEILQHLATCHACCCKDVVGRLTLAQSTVSQHLKVLVDAGLVQVSREGQRSRYEADRSALTALARDVEYVLHACGVPIGPMDPADLSNPSELTPAPGA
jgi:ArsR family transcriptional regulator, arsenate/arsenite/antimonite-responsive transcriptional repressor